LTVAAVSDGDGAVGEIAIEISENGRYGGDCRVVVAGWE